MGELRFNVQLHEHGERLPVTNTLISQALAWWIAADLIRRHPDDLTVIEMHPAGGQYNCISLGRWMPDLLFNPVVHMNIDPGAHLTHASWFGGDEEERFNWAEVLLCPNRREYVTRQLEAVERLGSPRSTPRTTRASIGPLVICAFLERSMLGPARWRAVNGVADSDYGADVRDDLFEQVPGAASVARARRSPDSERPEYRFWFIGPEGDNEWSLNNASFAVDVRTGQLWRAGSTDAVDLLNRYKEADRSLDQLVSDVCPPAF